MFSNPEKILLQFGISSGTQVADFGAGSGFYSLLLAGKVGETGKVFSIDVHKDMVKRLSREAQNRNHPNLEATWGDLEHENGSGLQAESVDAVIVANTFFSIENKKALALEAKRVLRKKGRVLLVEWADSFAGMGPHRDHVVSKDDAKKIFEEAGFHFENEIEAGEHHYGLVFRV